MKKSIRHVESWATSFQPQIRSTGQNKFRRFKLALQSRKV